MRKTYELEDFCFEVPLELRSSLFEPRFPAVQETGPTGQRNAWQRVTGWLSQLVGQRQNAGPSRRF